MKTRKVRVRIEPVQGPECPSSWGGWHLYSFSERHRSFQSPWDFFDEEKTRAALSYAGGEPVPVDEDMRGKIDRGLAFPLSYYEHGDCRWSLYGEGPKCQFDSTRFAGVLVWEADELDMQSETVEGRRLDAKHFVDVYTAWANGSVNEFCVESDDPVESSDEWSGEYYDVGDEMDRMMRDIREAVGEGVEIEVCGNGAWLTKYHPIPERVEKTEEI